MYEPRSKKIATIIVGGMGGESGERSNGRDVYGNSQSEESGESDMREEALKAAAGGMIKAMKAGNPEQLAEALKTAFRCMG